MKWGLLSTANINRKLLEGVRGTDEATVVAVASRDRSRAEAFAREHGIERALGSYEELLADPEVEAIYIPLPNSMHVPWSVQALEAGKHVLCEKPLTRHPADAEAAFAAAERSGRLLMEAFMWRHHPQTRRLRELLDAGVIGRLRLVRASFSFPLDEAENIRLNGELEGGGLMDVGCYCLSGSRFVAGAEPERVSAEQVLGGKGSTSRSPPPCASRMTCWPSSTAGSRSGTATTSRRSARRARSTSPIPGTAARRASC